MGRGETARGLVGLGFRSVAFLQPTASLPSTAGTPRGLGPDTSTRDTCDEYRYADQRCAPQKRAPFGLRNRRNGRHFRLGIGTIRKALVRETLVSHRTV